MLRSSVWTRWLSDDYQHYFYSIFVLVTLVLNILMIASWEAPANPSNFVPELPPWSVTPLLTVQLIHIVVSFVLALVYYVNHMRDDPTPSQIGMFTYYAVFFVLSAIGPVTGGYFYSLHLLHAVQANQTLKECIQSITEHWRSLLAVTAFGVVLIYLFSLLGFAFFRRDYDPNDGMYCHTLGDCFAATLKNGLLAGGGMGDVLVPEVYSGTSIFTGRLVYDLAFFVLVTVIIMNLVLGIIVDTFSELRSNRAELEEDQTNKCFVCGFESHEFEQVGGFEAHLKSDHNMWNYLYYYIYLRDRNASDRSYHEVYLYDHFVQNKSIDPFPVGKSMRLAAHIDDSADRLVRIEDRLGDVERLIRRRYEEQDREELARFVVEHQSDYMADTFNVPSSRGRVGSMSSPSRGGGRFRPSISNVRP